MGKAYAEAKKEHGDSDLLGEIVATSPQPDLKGIESKDELRVEGLAKLREAVELLASKATPEEVDGYRAFTLTVAQRAAEADKSGGVVGIGGERVSDAEREALAASRRGARHPAAGAAGRVAELSFLRAPPRLRPRSPRRPRAGARSAPGPRPRSPGR